MIKLFGRWKRDSYDKKCIDNVSDPEKEPMKIWITSKSSVDGSMMAGAENMKAYILENVDGSKIRRIYLDLESS